MIGEFVARIEASTRHEEFTWRPAFDPLPRKGSRRYRHFYRSQLLVYSDVCSVVLRLVYLAVRLHSHVASAVEHFMRVEPGVDVPDTREGVRARFLQFKELLAPLSALGALDATLLDRFLLDTARASRLPLSYLYERELHLARMIVTHRAPLLDSVWGVRVGEPDCPTRCGPFVAPDDTLPCVFPRSVGGCSRWRGGVFCRG